MPGARAAPAFEAAQQQPGLERAEQRAGIVAVGPDRRPPLIDLLRDQRAREHVAVAVQVLGRRVHDEIGAERERAGQDRGRGGAVHGKESAGGVRDLGGARDVDDVEQGVGGRLDPDDRRLCLGNHALEAGRIGAIEMVERDLPVRAEPGEPGERAVVDRALHDDCLAAPERAEQRRDRGHPRGEHQGVGAAFERAQHRFDLRVARAVVPPVGVGRIEERIGFVASEGGRRLDRRHQAAGRRVDVVAELSQHRRGLPMGHASVPGVRSSDTVNAPSFSPPAKAPPSRRARHPRGDARGCAAPPRSRESGARTWRWPGAAPSRRPHPDGAPD